MKCPACGSKDIDFHEAGGHSYCVSCGTVLEENAIVSTIEFQDSGGGSSVIGQFVSASCSRSFNSNNRLPGRYDGNSREITLMKVKGLISQVSSSLCLPPLYIDRAYRLYSLALQRNFIFGRRQMHVVATCLYTVCREEKSPHLLIDFSDALQINVFLLGKAFLQFVRQMQLNLPVVDPSLYIHRFAQRLELGEKISAVATTALRIVTRLRKDWIITGRRPDGVCAAALLIASRSHGFYKSQGEIAKMFRISAETLKNRIDDFKATPSAQLTLEQFHQNDSNVEFDPPSFIRNQINEIEIETEAALNNSTDSQQQPSYLYLSLDNPDDCKENKIQLDDDFNNDNMDKTIGYKRTMVGVVDVEVALPNKPKKVLKLVQSLKQQARQALYEDLYSEMRETADPEHALILQQEAYADETMCSAGQSWGTNKKSKIHEFKESFVLDLSSKQKIGCVSTPGAGGTDSVSEPLNLATNMIKMKAIKQEAIAGMVKIEAKNEYHDEDEELKLKEDEELKQEEEHRAIETMDVACYLLDEEEQQKRSVIWENAFRGFMDERQKRREAKEAAGSMNDGRTRKKAARRNISKASTSEAVLDAAATVTVTKKPSKKINYEALMGVFGGDGNYVVPSVVQPTTITSQYALNDVDHNRHNSTGLDDKLWNKKNNSTVSNNSLTELKNQKEPISSSTSVNIKEVKPFIKIAAENITDIVDDEDDYFYENVEYEDNYDYEEYVV